MSTRAWLVQHRSLRWVVPAGVVGAIGLAAAGAFSASASTSLPPRTAAQLLADVESAKVSGFSGTVVSTASLGLPQIPSLSGSSTSETPLGLLSGSHTARVWYAGPTKQRVALVDPVGEYDVFRNGADMWQWSSSDRTATHTTLPANAASATVPQTLERPDQVAAQALAAIDPTTAVSVDENRPVADRKAYQLVLTPKAAGASRIGSVRIGVDAATKLPVEVRVFARGATSAAIDVKFTRLTVHVPDGDNFRFTPPKGATVKHASVADQHDGQPGGADRSAVAAPDGVRTVGTGWTTVVSGRVPSTSATSPEALQLLGGLTKVSGPWGSGRLFQSALVCALLTDDGRLYAGAVDPAVLYAAAK